jgi:carbamoyltransferase
MYILGISAYYHDSAAVLIKDGNIVAAAQEERFTRKKHDDGFPRMAAEYCLKEAGIGIAQVEHVVFYDKPILKFDRLLETYLSYVPGGWISLRKAIPLWLSKKLHLPKIIKKELGWKGKVLFTEHHESHAASAFFPSPFEEAAIICFDGVGEWATTTWGVGKGYRVEIKQQISFPHSLGLLYSAFTYYTGFKVNSGEYKVMGLAPYGEPKYVELIMNELIDIKEDGSFRMNMKKFNYCQGLTMTNRKFSKLFGGPPRKPEEKVTQREMDIAASIQKITEEIMLRIERYVYEQTGQKNLCMAGGVALNCVGNGRLLREGPFENIWVQPSAGDAGGALGAALTIWHHYLDRPREVNGKEDKQYGSYLGPHFTKNEIKKFLDENGYPYREYLEEDLYDDVAKRLETGEVIGWFQDRMEFGPRALGARSIIGDARNPEMQKKMNLKIKYRESFRPFAPSVLLEHVSKWFEHDKESPYMLMVAPVKEDRRIPMTDEQGNLFGIDKLNISRSSVPAVTHVDYSARIQTVDGKYNKRYYKLMKKFYENTDCPVIVNTSFNVRDEPIVCTPVDAYRCFMRTEMDTLVLGDLVLLKNNQPEWKEKKDWREEFGPDLRPVI